jgi:hypothetical protein
LNSAEIDELWYRNLAAGITKVEMIVSQILLNMFALVLLNCTTVISALLVLDIRILDGNEIYLALLAVLTVLSAQYTGFFLVALCNSQSMLNNIMFVIGCFVSYLCGENSQKI